MLVTATSDNFEIIREQLFGGGGGGGGGGNGGGGMPRVFNMYDVLQSI